jgi:hypothetical protein
MAAAPRGDEGEIDREAEPERERARREGAATRRETLPFPSPATHQLTHSPGDEHPPKAATQKAHTGREWTDRRPPCLHTPHT